MALQRLRPGQQFAPQGRTWNAFADAAEDFQRRMASQRGAPVGTATSAGIVTIKNVSGTSVLRFGILAISGIVIDPADNEAEFKIRPVFTADAPDETNKSRLVITQEPIADGTFGRAVVMGVTVVQIDVQNEDHEFAEAVEGDTAKLQSGSAGPCRILWEQAGTGVKWAWVQMPVSPPAETTRYAVFNGTRTGRRYTGACIDPVTGVATEACQWIFLNDPGEDTLLDAGNYVEIKPAPAFALATGAFGDVATFGQRYVAILSPWAAWAQPGT